MEEQVLLVQGREGKTRARPKYAPEIVKHSKIEYKEGRFIIKGDKSALEKKIPEDLGKM